MKLRLTAALTLFLLAREAEISPELRNDLIKRLRTMGYNTDALYWTPQR